MKPYATMEDVQRVAEAGRPMRIIRQFARSYLIGQAYEGWSESRQQEYENAVPEGDREGYPIEQWLADEAKVFEPPEVNVGAFFRQNAGLLVHARKRAVVVEMEAAIDASPNMAALRSRMKEMVGLLAQQMAIPEGD